MLFRKPFKEAIRAGRVTCSYRRWKKPQAKVGGRYNLHPEGAIEVTAIDRVTLAEISAAQASAAGFKNRAALLELLGENASAGQLYRVQFTYLGPALVKIPDTSGTTAVDTTRLREKLSAMDRRARTPWTPRLLQLLLDNPGVRAADLAPVMDWETPRLKSQVRKLKALGLTISLETGYEVSPRGQQILAAAVSR